MNYGIVVTENSINLAKTGQAIVKFGFKKQELTVTDSPRKSFKKYRKKQPRSKKSGFMKMSTFKKKENLNKSRIYPEKDFNSSFRDYKNTTLGVIRGLNDDHNMSISPSSAKKDEKYPSFF